MTVILSILNTLFGGVLQGFFKQWLAYKSTLATSKEAGAAAAMNADAVTLQELMKSEVQIDALKVQVYGSFTYRVVTLLVGIPIGVHFALIFADTILASKFLYGASVLGVPSAPAPYDGYEWTVVASFFLVHAVNQGTSNLTKWLKS
jgi:hypothetical protein